MGHTFEVDAESVLTAIFRDVCPWAEDHSEFLSRTIDTGTDCRQADLMCYVSGDTSTPCVNLAHHGVYVLEPVQESGAQADPEQSAKPAPHVDKKQRFSPTDASRLGPHKYFVAEVYGGVRMKSVEGKVEQLETLCDFVRRRWVDRQAGGALAAADLDISRFVGAAALVFRAELAGSRRSDAVQTLARKVDRFATKPNLRRLRQAGRVFLLVLDKSQCPLTTSQSAVAKTLGSHSAHLQKLEAAVQQLQETMQQQQETTQQLQVAVQQLQVAVQQQQNTTQQLQVAVQQQQAAFQRLQESIDRLLLQRNGES